MTALTLACLLSLFGAGLFFAAGLFLGRARPTPAADRPALDDLPTIQMASPETDVMIADLRGQVFELDARLRELNESRAAEREELDRLRRERGAAADVVRKELAMELAVAHQRMGELETLRRENEGLRRGADEAVRLGERLVAAEEELRSVRARRLSASPPPLPAVRPRPRGTEPRCTSEVLSGLLLRMQSSKGMRAVTLADDLGLPIVGAGDDISSLAAFSALVSDIGKKTGDFLPFGKLRRITLEDEQDTTITACPFDAGASKISLVTLTIGPGPSPRQVGEVLRSAASMIQ